MKKQVLNQEQENFLNENVKGTWNLNSKTGLVDVDGDFIINDKPIAHYKNQKKSEKKWVPDPKGKNRLAIGRRWSDDQILLPIARRSEYLTGDTIFERGYWKVKTLKYVKRYENLRGIFFGEVNGNFSCRGLSSLEGAPILVRGYFCCGALKQGNESWSATPPRVLKSLKGGPKEVGGYFDCERNVLTSLEGAPMKVGGDFDCGMGNITSLEHAPKEVGGDFICQDNPITSLKGSPRKIKGTFNCGLTKITDLRGGPVEVYGNFRTNDCELTSLDGLPKIIKDELDVRGNSDLNSIEGIEKIGSFKSSAFSIGKNNWNQKNFVSFFKVNKGGDPSKSRTFIYPYLSPANKKDYLLVNI